MWPRDDDVVEEQRRRRYLRPFGGATRADAIARAIVDGGIEEHEAKISSVVHSINGKRAVVIDGAIGERERRRVADRYVKLTGDAAQQGWHREKASDFSLEHNAMAKDMPFEECDGAALAVIRSLLPHFFDRCDPERPAWVTRCSLYMQTFIDVDEAHEDRSHDAKGFSVTAIWYPHERWHAHWGGETVFLSGSNPDAELVLPVLPKPGRLLLFDSEISHMAKPATPIAEPFRPSAISHVVLPSTRTTGNRFSFVLRTLCSTRSIEELIAIVDTHPEDGKLSRQEAMQLFRFLEFDRPDGAYQRLGRIAGSRVAHFTADHLKRFFDVRYAQDAPRDPPIGPDTLYNNNVTSHL
ncbi:hypothetical protein CTAYLR_006595 [Chrysophaeum taylorii]|uniref:Prolyl 4-hydroxylase alpha subunit Fe(2+) 2OG dioxygenase domain-containing protein n=1 Tax=Chrysophaeum taylorii TaxID=2483200 RepID=A0AAD7UMY2_9STRA|nr:hypothetical protein CTAYLR_006595 [Chrysophaeum taylorii]